MQFQGDCGSGSQELPTAESKGSRGHGDRQLCGRQEQPGGTLNYRCQPSRLGLKFMSLSLVCCWFSECTYLGLGCTNVYWKKKKKSTTQKLRMMFYLMDKTEDLSPGISLSG